MEILVTGNSAIASSLLPHSVHAHLLRENLLILDLSAAAATHQLALVGGHLMLNHTLYMC
eukprot:1153408-Pelagomonas_calceolata.AAC.6